MQSTTQDIIAHSFHKERFMNAELISDRVHHGIYLVIYKCTLVPRPSRSMRVIRNASEQEEKWERPGIIYHVP